MNWYAICNADGHYWTGERDEYSTNPEYAKLFTEEEKELSFCFPNEFWLLLPNHGDA